MTVGQVTSKPEVHDEIATARARLEAALAERHHLRRRFDESIGTLSELAAYSRLRRASEQVAAWDRWVRWLESEDFLRSPRRDDSLMESLIGHEAPAFPPPPVV